MRKTHIALASALAVLLLALAAPTVAAHKTTYSADGKVKIVWGFLNEPALTMTKTGLDLILTDNATGAPIEGVEKTLNASLVYGSDVHEFEDFAPQHGQKGRYTDKITLTRPGIYSLRLAGTINGTAVNMDIQGAHEIGAIEETYFPTFAAPADASGKVTALESKVAQLEAKIAALEAKAATQSQTPATLTSETPRNSVPAPGAASLLALASIAAVLVMRRPQA
jgi:hypothetical protein